MFSTLYLMAIAYMRPYGVKEDNLFGAICEVEVVFVLLASLLMNFQRQVKEGGGEPADDDAWFQSLAAILVLTPVPIAIFTSVYQGLLPVYLDWIDARDEHPASRPSFTDFVVFGRESSMPPDKRGLLESALPADVQQLSLIHI